MDEESDLVSVVRFSTHQARQVTYLSSSDGTAPERPLDERSTSIGLRADIELKKSVGIVPTKSFSVCFIKK